MPTQYPKGTPTEMMGLLVLLNDHKGSEDVARLADDLDLEIDEILPSTDFAEALGFLKVQDGKATLTQLGRELLAGSIRGRKSLLREQLSRNTLFKALLRALEKSPERRLTDREVSRLIEFTTPPTDEVVQNIINWGRFAELFRYDADQSVLLPSRVRSSARTASPPTGGSGGTGGGGTSSEPGARGGRGSTEPVSPTSQVARRAQALV